MIKQRKICVYIAGYTSKTQFYVTQSLCYNVSIIRGGNMFHKNDQIEIEILDIGENGEGIGKVDGYTIFVHEGIPGDIADVKILKVKKQYAIGKVTSLIKASPFRVKPECSIAKLCGGCQVQDISYDEQLRIKRGIVESSIERIGGFKDVKVNEVIGMDNPRAYRNKSQYPVKRDDGKILIGFYKQRTHEVVDAENCMVQHDVVNEMMVSLRKLLNDCQISIYDEEKHKGFLRHVVVRISHKTEDMMLIFVTNKGYEVNYDQLLEISTELSKEFPQIKSFIQNINSSKGNRIMGNENHTILGDDKIVDYIKDLTFEISPLSFLQVNPVQTEVLYDTALNMLNVTKEDTVIDIYCGIGTISLFLAKHAKKVYGVESVNEAIEDARKNAINNKIDNAEFIAGRAEDVIPKLLKNGTKADIVVLDPPRKGCEEIVLQSLLEMAPKRICYISCKASTLARDLKILSVNYKIEEVQPVDLFPYTTHIETVVLLSRISK